jgi:hypothetical protein
MSTTFTRRDPREPLDGGATLYERSDRCLVCALLTRFLGKRAGLCVGDFLVHVVTVVTLRRFGDR